MIGNSGARAGDDFLRVLRMAREVREAREAQLTDGMNPPGSDSGPAVDFAEFDEPEGRPPAAPRMQAPMPPHPADMVVERVDSDIERMKGEAGERRAARRAAREQDALPKGPMSWERPYRLDADIESAGGPAALGRVDPKSDLNPDVRAARQVTEILDRDDAEARARQRAADAVKAQEQEAATSRTKAAADKRASAQAAAARQRMLEEQRDKELRARVQRAEDYAADPAAVKEGAARARGAMAAAHQPPRDDKGRPITYTQQQHNRDEAANLAADVRAHEAAMRQYTARRDEILRRKQQAEQDGDGKLALQLAQQLDALPKPVASDRVTGGRSPQEMIEPVEDTLQGLRDTHKAEHRALVDHYGTDARGLEDMSVTYGDLTPDERRQVMINDAQRIMKVPQVPTMEVETGGGYGKGIGDDAEDEDVRARASSGQSALPRDRVTKDGRLVRGTAWREDGVPVVDKPGQRHGTFVENPTGSISARAPNPDQIEAYEHLDPYPARLTPEFRQQMLNLGVAVLGFDPSQIANNGIIIDAAQRALAEHQRMSGKYDTAAVATGGYRYRPNEATRRNMGIVGLRADVGAFIDAHGLSEETQLMLWKAADEGNKDEVARIKREVYRSERGSQSAALKDRRRAETETRAMQDPRLAPAMLAGAIGQAQGDPRRTAMAYRQAGMPGEGARVDALENDRIRAGGDIEREELEKDVVRGRGRGTPEMTGPQANAAGAREYMDQAFSGEVAPATAITSYMIHHNQARTQTGLPALKPEEAVVNFASEILATKGVSVGWENKIVQQALMQLAKQAKESLAGTRYSTDDRMMPSYALSQPQEFLRLVKERLGAGLETAAQSWWNQTQR